MAQADSLFALACQQANLTAQPGKQAMKGAERDSVELEGKGRWTHSVDLDGAHAKSEAQSPRWDYAWACVVRGWRSAPFGWSLIRLTARVRSKKC